MNTTVPTRDGSYRIRRRLPIIALVLLLMLAGCGSFGGAQSPTEDSPTPEEQNLTDTSNPPTSAAEWPEAEIADVEPLGEMTLPPGIDESQAVNTTRLLAAHSENQPTAGYRLQVDPVAVDTGSDTTVVLDQGEARVRLHRMTGESTTTYWASQPEMIVAVNDASGVTYARGSTPTAERMLDLSDSARTAVLPYVRFGEFELAGAVTIGERRYARLNLTGFDSRRLAASPWDPVGQNRTVEDTTGFVLVSPDGVISYARIEVAYARDDAGTATDVLRYQLRDDAALDLGQPNWVSDVPHIEASLAGSGTQLMLENVGQQPIPAGTELRVLAEEAELGVVEVPERVDPDEQMYLTVTWGEVNATTSVRAHLQPPDPTNRTVDLRRFNTLAVEGRSEAGVFQVAP